MMREEIKRKVRITKVKKKDDSFVDLLGWLTDDEINERLEESDFKEKIYYNYHFIIDVEKFIENATLYKMEKQEN